MPAPEKPEGGDGEGWIAARVCFSADLKHVSTWSNLGLSHEEQVIDKEARGNGK